MPGVDLAMQAVGLARWLVFSDELWEFCALR